MRDNDDLHNIPPLVPSRDELVTRQRSRSTSQIVNPNQYAETIKVSTWPVRIMLGLLFLGFAAAAYGAYTFYELYQVDLRQSNLRIVDLENRLALVGDSAEETTANVLERVDLNFAEIDKLWAARRVINQTIEDLTGRVTLTEDGVKDTKDGLEMANQLIVQSTSLLEQTRRELTTVQATSTQNSQVIAGLNTSVQSLQTFSQDMLNFRATLVAAQGESGGLDERVRKVEEAVEAIDAFRLQINQTLLRLQQNIEAVQQAQ